jgi:hypothetical protein
MNRLLNIGFRRVGSWNQTPSGIACAFDDCADTRNILYSFICGQTVLYVGKTVGSLKKRMYGYQNPGPTQSTNIKGNRNISALLADGNKVEIFALPDNGLLHFGVFHINLAAGLEDSIVRTLNPRWNQIGGCPHNSYNSPILHAAAERHDRL